MHIPLSFYYLDEYIIHKHYKRSAQQETLNFRTHVINY